MKKKLSIQKLQITSFITSQPVESQTVKGGFAFDSGDTNCLTEVKTCGVCPDTFELAAVLPGRPKK